MSPRARPTYADHSRFGRMVVVETDQFRGRRYRCACRWTGWSVWGRALKHAQTCSRAKEVPT